MATHGLTFEYHLYAFIFSHLLVLIYVAECIVILCNSTVQEMMGTATHEISWDFRMKDEVLKIGQGELDFFRAACWVFVQIPKQIIIVYFLIVLINIMFVLYHLASLLSL